MPLLNPQTEPEGVAGRYDFGGVVVSLASDSRRWARLARRRYRAFGTDRPADWQAVYRLRDPRLPDPRSLYSGRAEALRARRLRERLELTAASFELTLDLRRHVASLDGPLATYPVDRLIQALWYEIADSGLVFHGAALADRGRGWLASGPSGSGKSTLAALLPEQALCDELAAVRVPDATCGTSPRLVSLPFWDGRPGSATLAGIYLLRHGERDHRRRLSAGEAFVRLRRQVVWPVYDGRALRRAFSSLGRLLEKIRVWELRFRPRPAVWDVIRREAA